MTIHCGAIYLPFTPLDLRNKSSGNNPKKLQW